MTCWQMYWFTRLDSFKTLFRFATGFSIVFLIVLLILFIAMVVEWDDDDDDVRAAKKRVLNVVKKIAILAVILGLLAAFIPTQKEAAAIYLVPKITHNKQLSGIADDGVKLLRLKLREWIGDLEDGDCEKK